MKNKASWIMLSLTLFILMLSLYYFERYISVTVTTAVGEKKEPPSYKNDRSNQAKGMHFIVFEFSRILGWSWASIWIFPTARWILGFVGLMVSAYQMTYFDMVLTWISVSWKDDSRPQKWKLIISHTLRNTWTTLLFWHKILRASAK